MHTTLGPSMPARKRALLAQELTDTPAYVQQLLNGWSRTIALRNAYLQTPNLEAVAQATGISRQAVAQHLNRYIKEVERQAAKDHTEWDENYDEDVARYTGEQLEKDEA